MKLRLAGAAIAACVALGTFAPTQPAFAQEVTKLRIGYIPIGIYSYFWRARDAGYFKDENIEVELVPMAGGARLISRRSMAGYDAARP